MALVRALVVWDMLSVAVHLPDLATVLLPSHNRAPRAAGRESVLIQCAQLPPGEEGKGKSHRSKSSQMVPLTQTNPEQAMNQEPLKGLYQQILTVTCQETKRKIHPFVVFLSLCLSKPNWEPDLSDCSSFPDNKASFFLFFLLQSYNLAFGQKAVNTGLRFVFRNQYAIF